ncbi:Uncharacterised protein [Vibrio cholerae]|uniref:Uncharacterized protein n=1 Tax=Vibrio cholerae TaxID=666 RepID=A0A656A2M7_VIBCL|nr:Uncharacterised protein [Vibrio cholerae]CRZ73485.1 Uncharacterised protein [Vibrio cholerae]CSB20270.1 Uncharacterised protein [Vibrio cholerae]CSB60400.1 Uncharacterised protein [Vibrio cholerae]CSB61264.1 Uncharacterised protein [Vibrio cholerae]
MQLFEFGIGIGFTKRDKRLPHRQKIQASTEASFCNHKSSLVIVVPSLWEMILLKEHIARLSQTIDVREINIVKLIRDGGSCVVPAKLGV